MVYTSTILYKKLMYSFFRKRKKQHLLFKIVHKKIVLYLIETLIKKIKFLFINTLTNSYLSYRIIFFQLKHLLFHNISESSNNSLFFVYPIERLHKVSNLLNKQICDYNVLFLNLDRSSNSFSFCESGNFLNIFSSRGLSSKDSFFLFSNWFDSINLLNISLSYYSKYCQFYYKNESSLLEVMSIYFQSAALLLNILNLKSWDFCSNMNVAIFNLPTKIQKFTVLRSPHIDTKSKEQFEKRIYRKGISLPNYFAPALGSHFFKKRLSNEFFFSMTGQLIKQRY